MPKRNNDILNLSEVLKDFVKSNKLEKGLDKVNVRESWSKLLGNGVNNYTTAIELINDTLFVKLSSSVLREELKYGQTKIIEMLNTELGKPLIKKLVLA